MNEQNKIKATLSLMLLLSNGYGLQMEEIMRRLALSERTARRYVGTLRDVGFIIPRPKDGYYKIEEISSTHKGLNKLLHFSEEEAFVLQRAIESLRGDSLVKQNLTKKLYSLYKSERVTEIILKETGSENIHRISESIKRKKRVLLKNYQSANSNSRRDRLVEPFKFTTNYVNTWAYDVDDDLCKMFKNTRIDSVEVLHDDWEHEDRHFEKFTDVFRMTGGERTSIELKLTVRSCELLKEEYPLAEKFITMLSDNEFLFKTDVAGFYGVGRFVLGLFDEIEIIAPQALRDFVRVRAEEMLCKLK
ncbi:MAG: helix-turn-helix transcriptional regulator [Mangrovibacterium sp.]